MGGEKDYFLQVKISSYIIIGENFHLEKIWSQTKYT